MSSRGPAYDKVNEDGKEADGPDEELVENGGRYTWKKAIGQVTIRCPLSAAESPPLTLIALVYGFLPWLIPFGLVTEFLITWHFIYIYGPLMSGVLALINELILKKIFNQPRPKQTANRDKDGKIKPGMPSGHVLNATSIMVWALLEVYFDGPGLEQNAQLTYTWLAIILASHIPVPWARWYNLDHTFNQCLVSSIIGTFVGATAFYLRWRYFAGVWKPWMQQVGVLPTGKPIVDFYTPPWVPLTTTGEPHDHSNSLLLL
jgi:hypothetical protein